MSIFRRARNEPSDQPGAASQPEGDGPVTLADRLDDGSPGANQGKTEPISPTPDHPEPMGVPTLAEMNVGVGDPQAPSHPAAGGPRLPGWADGHGDTATAPMSGTGPAEGTSQTQPPVDGPPQS